MPRRPASITQSDYARILRAAKQAGAAEVELRIGETPIIIRIAASSTGEQTPLEPREKIVL
jgi:hypothetical protein